MALTYVFMIGSYWLFLTGAVFMTGALTARMFITGPSGADACIYPEKKRPFGETAVPLVLTISVLTLIAIPVHVVLHCSVMTGTPLPEVWDIFPVFLMKTRYGTFSLIRTGILAVIVYIVSSLSRRDNKGLWGAAYAGTIALVITLAMSGHQGSKGYLTIPFILDLVHVLAISLWIGGIFFIYLNYACFCKRADKEHWGIFLSLIHRISLMATICVVLVLFTGTALYFYSFKDPAMVFSTRYGSVLLIKTGFALVLIIIGGVNKYIFIPGLVRTELKDWTRLCSFRNGLFTAMTTEVYLGLAILLATSVLNHLSPGE